MKFRWILIYPLLMVLRCSAGVQTPPPPSAPPSGYCTTIYTELKGYLDAFNQTLGNPAPYPTVQLAQLQMADSNVGPGLSGPSYLDTVMVQVQELKAMGFEGVKVEVAFPVLYQPFFGSAGAMQPYLDFYQNLAANVHAMGLKLLVENNVTLSTGTQAGWPDIRTYYQSLSWDQFVAGRAEMAATIAQVMQPDFLMLSQEPDNEAANAGQPNLNTPLMAAAMISAEITAARAVAVNTTLGAGVGSWMGPYPPNGLDQFLDAYVALPLDYIDIHIYPINTEFGGQANLLNNALVMAARAAAAGKPVAISESWPWKMENAEFNVVSPDTFRARNVFDFWAPIDTYFIQTMQKLANYARMLYLTSQGNNYFLAYQTYGGTVENGGAATCTCTTASCSNADITTTENRLANNAGQAASFTTTGLFYSGLLISPPDTVAPSSPSHLGGTAGYNSTSLAWTGSTDNVGVAGYNIYRCSPPPCTGSWIANAAATRYYDSGLNDNTSYQYEVQAFDIGNRTSGKSNVLNLTTALNTPPNAPGSVSATAVSPKEIDVSWTPPQDSAGLGKYIVYQGSSAATLAPIATVPASSTRYRDQPLIPGTPYVYGVVAVEQGLNSPMSPLAAAITLPLPDPPDHVTATAVSATRIALTWQEALPPGGLPIANYQVLRGTTPGVYTKVATVLSPSYNSTGLLPGTTYYFEIVAVDTGHDLSTPSDPVSATTYAMPPAPAGLQATAPAATRIQLTWQWAPPADGLPLSHYNVLCGTSRTAQEPVGHALSTSFTYNKASAATSYYCSVEAVDTGNDVSNPSPNVHEVTPPMPPAPTGLQATASGATKFKLSWQWTAIPAGLPLAHFNIYCGSPSGNQPLVGHSNTTTFTYNGASAATGYSCYVVAVDTGNDASGPSDNVSVETPPMPPPPAGLQAGTPAATQVSLTWHWAPQTGGLPIAHFDVYCGTSNQGQPRVGSTATSAFTYKGAEPSTRYYCYVVAADTGNDLSAPSATVAVTTPPMPNAPSQVEAAASAGPKITVTWAETLPPNGLPIASYKIYRSSTPVVNTSDYLATRTSTTFTDQNVSGAQTYYYAISAIDTGGDASPLSSPPAQATTR